MWLGGGVRCSDLMLETSWLVYGTFPFVLNVKPLLTVPVLLGTGHDKCSSIWKITPIINVTTLTLLMLDVVTTEIMNVKTCRL